ncbi:OmpA family protein [Caulobacter sp. ErkDOM-E]|uniref:OmpA family protein n=1 Tax=Caulobacter sp. ErkDOM-E TaxID=3402778 RepID=UPI003AF7DD3C
MTLKITAAALGAGLMLAGCASAPGRPTRASIEALPPACADFQVSIYFERDQARVTREARSVLKSAGAMTRGCKVDRARITGLADAVGAPDANMELSRRRAEAVTRALIRAGLGKAEFDVAAAGDAGATTRAGASAPLRRRADIVFEISKP